MPTSLGEPQSLVTVNRASRPAAVTASAAARGCISTCRCSRASLGVVVFGMFILYSAVGTDTALWFGQGARLGVGFAVMIALAQMPDALLPDAAPRPPTRSASLLLLVVAVEGEIGKGAQRWLDLGFVTFQPSEMLKLGVPMMCAWFLHERPSAADAAADVDGVLIVLTPAVLIAEQPDLGTALPGRRRRPDRRWSLGGLRLDLPARRRRDRGAAVPVLWASMHDYQRQRVFTFLNPESDPLGTGYNIIQSKIAIGSGGAVRQGLVERHASRTSSSCRNARRISSSR